MYSSVSIDMVRALDFVVEVHTFTEAHNCCISDYLLIYCSTLSDLFIKSTYIHKLLHTCHQ